MADNSTEAIRHILEHEGGYVNDPKDPGGPTNKGITIATFRRFVNPAGTIRDLKNLTEAQAVKVYKRRYWDKVRGDLLPSGVDYTVADFGVNSGPERAAKYLQKALGVVVDGDIGPETLRAAAESDPRLLINTICDERLAYMKRIRGGALWERYKNGWSRRVSEVRQHSLEWVEFTPQAPSKPVRVSPPPKAKRGLVAAFLALFTRG